MVAEDSVVVDAVKTIVKSGRTTTFYLTPSQYPAVNAWYWTPSSPNKESPSTGMTDPKNLTYIGDTDFTDPDPDPEAAESGLTVAPEGNGHQAEFTLDNRYVIGADEDFAPYALSARNLDDDTPITAGQGIPLEEGKSVSGGTVYAGLACNDGPAVPAGAVGAALHPTMGLGQHRVRLADARRRAEVNPKLAACHLLVSAVVCGQGGARHPEGVTPRSGSPCRVR
jgi:hypothetical protein